MLQLHSKLPDIGTTIFTIMSKLSNQHGAINLSQGFPNWDCDPVLKSLVNNYVQKGYNQYAPMAGIPKLRESLAHKIKSLYDLSIDVEKEITVVAGATQGVFTAISAFVKPGDEVIIVEPAYDSYSPGIVLNGGIPVPYQLRKPDYKIDWDHFESLITDKTKMILFNTPHNPTGKIFSPEDIKALDQISKDKNIVIVSDEVYEHLVYDGQKHESVLKYPSLYERSLAVYSFGKTFHSTGWKLGYVVGPEYLMEEFRKAHQFNVFSVNHPIQCAIADYMENPETYLGLENFFEQKRNLFQELLAKTRFKPIACEGTYFQMVDYSDITQEKDTEFAKRITIENGVSAIPVSVFYTNPPEDYLLRFCFAKTDELLIEAGEKLAKI